MVYSASDFNNPTWPTGAGGQSQNSFFLLLKQVYGPLWDRMVMSKTKVNELLGIGKSAGRMGGSQTVNAARTGLPQSAGIPAFEHARLPTPSTGTYLNPLLIARDRVGRLRWSVQVEAAARMGKKAAFIGPRKVDMMDARAQMQLHIARNTYLGYADILATVESFSGTTVELYSKNDRDSDVGDWFKFGLTYLKPNMPIAFVDNSVGVMGDPAYNIEDHGATNERTVSTIDNSDPANPSFDISAAPPSFTPAVGDWVILYGSRKNDLTNDSNVDADFAGTNGLLMSATATFCYSYLYGIDKSANAEFSGIHSHNSGTARAYSEDLTTMLIDRIHDEGKGDEVDTLIEHRAVRRAVVAELNPDRRYAPVVTKSGFGALQYNAGDVSITRSTDWMCPAGVEFALKKSHFNRYERWPVTFHPERFVADYLANEIPFSMSGNMETVAPFSSGMLDDIQFDAYALVP